MVAICVPEEMDSVLFVLLVIGILNGVGPH